jgi:hypothetical protein
MTPEQLERFQLMATRSTSTISGAEIQVLLDELKGVAVADRVAVHWQTRAEELRIESERVRALLREGLEFLWVDFDNPWVADSVRVDRAKEWESQVQALLGIESKL